MQKKHLLFGSLALAMVLSLGFSAQAEAATTLSVPKPLMDLWKKVQSQRATAQEAGTLAPAPSATLPPSDSSAQPTAPTQITPVPAITPSVDNSLPQPVMDGQKPEPFSQQQPMTPQDTRDMRTIQRGVNQMESNINQFDRNIQRDQKNGMNYPGDMPQKMDRARGLIRQIKDANDFGDMGNNTMEELDGTMRDLQQDERQAKEMAQMLSGMKREMGNMERGLNMFQKQLARLTKQGIAAPSQMTEALAKLKELITKVKTAKSFEDVQDLDMQDFGELMQQINESQGQLNMLSRWPQTKNQIDRELKNLDRALKRDQAVVDKLAKQGVDLNDNLQKMTEEINQLRATRDQAAEKIKAGEAEEAFDLLENGVFEKIGDIWEEQRVFDTLSNLGRFNSEFKSRLAEAQRMIKRLEKRDEDVSELKTKLEEITAVGKELNELIKAKPVDIEEITTKLEELSDLRQEFESGIEEIGDGQQMPWEQGPNQFQNLKVSPNLNKFFGPSQQNHQ